MMIRSSSAVALLLLAMVAPSTYSQKSAAYVGSSQCETCHADLGAGWQTTRHAKAIDSLKKSGQEKLPACVQCHVTGYEKDGGFIDMDLTPEMAGVQCEACHGPGSVHIEDPSVDMIKDGGAELCRKCHTEKQDPGFKYEEKVKHVHGMIK